MKRLITGILFAMFLVGASSTLAQTTESSVTYQWTAPTTGSEVVEYVVQLEVDGSGWVEFDRSATLSYTFTDTFVYGREYAVRVAGVDAQGRWGPWSISSEPYTPDLGRPGQPGQPVLIEIP